ncbi:MAG: hypothetical protein ACP5N9_01690 [Candidatus Bilamarchaeum sp.]
MAGLEDDIPQSTVQRLVRPQEASTTTLTSNISTTARDNFLSSLPRELANYSRNNPNTLPTAYLDPNTARERLGQTTLRVFDHVLGSQNLDHNTTPLQVRHMALDLLAELERDLRRIMPEETPEHRRNLAEELIKQYLTNIESSATRLLIQAYQDPSLDQRQREQMRDSGLRVGLANANMQYQYGDTQAQTRFLLDTGSQLSNDQQREDMLRAAEMVGFTASAVFAAANLSGIGSRPSSQAPGMNIAQSLASTASERARELMANMREHLDEARTDQAKMEEFEFDRRALARLVGEGQAGRIARQLEIQNGENDSAIVASVREQMELSRRLNSGDLNIRLERA